MKKNQKLHKNIIKSAFTLAEVLVTLVIIGIIAGITIIILNSEYNEELLKTQFKTGYSILTQAIRKTVMYEYSGSLPCYYNSPGLSDTWGDCKPFYKALAKNLNIIKICNKNAKEDGCVPNYKIDISADSNCEGFSTDHINNECIVYVLANGQILITYSSYTGPLFLFDINGFRGPNKGGYDLFAFDIMRDSHKNLSLKTGTTCEVKAKGGKTTEEMILSAFAEE